MCIRDSYYIHDICLIKINLMQYFRQEKDSLGYVDVPEDAYWAAQTQRSIQNFKIGGHKMQMCIRDRHLYLL